MWYASILRIPVRLSNSVVLYSVVSDSLGPHVLTRLLYPWNFPGKAWGGLPFPPSGDLLTKVEPEFPTVAGGLSHSATWKAPGSAVETARFASKALDGAGVLPL